MKNANKKTNEIIEKIEAEKEILKTMPKNNKKNITKYLQNNKNLIVYTYIRYYYIIIMPYKKI